MGDRNLIGIFEVNFCGLSEERAAGDAMAYFARTTAEFPIWKDRRKKELPVKTT